MSSIVGASINNYIDATLDTENVNYYHKHLRGEYIPGDTSMYVTSIDTGEKILFSKENLAIHPRTAAIYKVPNLEYDTLCKKYPSQRDLIKSIVYPVPDPDVLDKKTVVSYLYGDTSLLQHNESFSIIEAIRTYCTIVNDRWWIKEFVYEEGYPIALYSLIWQHLPLICSTKRMTNIKTGSAHSYHVWEYLISKGMDDYRDVLTTKQAMFLYRNINYILANKGTANNLLVLSDNIISDFNITLYGKHIYQQQISRFDECRRTPEVISVPIVSYETSSQVYTNEAESISTINSRMFQKGIERINTISYVDELEKVYGEVEEDRLSTKLIELKKDPVNTSHKSLFLQFIIETLIYRLTKDNLSFSISFRDPMTDTTVKLHVADAFLVMYYAIHKSCNQTPVYTPKYSAIRIPYKMKKPSKEEIRKTVYINDLPYTVSHYLNLDKLLLSIPWHDAPIKSVSDFNDLIYDQFTVMLDHYYQLQQTASLLDHKCMMTAYNTFCEFGNFEKELTRYKTYDTFINSTETIQRILGIYNSTNDTSMFDQLATRILLSIINIGDTRFKRFVGATDSYSKQFETMTSLLIQLSSHNITFLGTSRETSDYMFMTPFVCHADHVHGTSSGVLDIDTAIKLRSYNYCTTTDVISADMTLSAQYTVSTTEETVYTTDISMDSQFHGETFDSGKIVNDIKIIYGE